jgi:SsrA-binding protein
MQKFTVDERIEAGLVLMGSEVKSLRARRVDLDGAYAGLSGGELFLYKATIAPYEQAGTFGHDPRRTRKLLVHRHEIEKLSGKLSVRGYTLVPLSLYFKDGKAKVELGLARAKDVADRREELKKKAAEREVRGAVAVRRGKAPGGRHG